MKKHWIFLGVCMLPICLWAGDDNDDIFKFDSDASLSSDDERKREEESGNEEESAEDLALSDDSGFASVNRSKSCPVPIVNPWGAADPGSKIKKGSIHELISEACKKAADRNGMGSVPVSSTKQCGGRNLRSSNPECCLILESSGIDSSVKECSFLLCANETLNLVPPPLSNAPQNDAMQSNVNVTLVIVSAPSSLRVEKSKSKPALLGVHNPDDNDIFGFESENEGVADSESSEENGRVLPINPSHRNAPQPLQSSPTPPALTFNWGGSAVQ